MPTVLRSGPYRFFFYSNEGREPAHIHVQRDRKTAKFWLSFVALASASGFTLRELRTIQGIVNAHRAHFLEAWNEYFGSGV